MEYLGKSPIAAALHYVIAQLALAILLEEAWANPTALQSQLRSALNTKDSLGSQTPSSTPIARAPHLPSPALQDIYPSPPSQQPPLHSWTCPQHRFSHLRCLPRLRPLAHRPTATPSIRASQRGASNLEGQLRFPITQPQYHPPKCSLPRSDMPQSRPLPRHLAWRPCHSRT